MKKITIHHIRPLIRRGFRQTEIARKFNLHKTTVNKILKNRIKSSRPIGVKPPIAKRRITPIWDYVENYYGIVWRTALQESYYLKTSPDELVNFLLDWLYSRNERFTKKLSRVKSPYAWLKACLVAILFERRRNIRKRKTAVVSLDIENI